MNVRIFTGPNQRRRRPVAQEPEATATLRGRSVPVIALVSIGCIDTRNLNTLSDLEILFAHQLAACTREQVASFSNFGERAIAQCREALDAIGFEHPGW